MVELQLHALDARLKLIEGQLERALRQIREPIEFSVELRRERKTRRLTQREAAELLGVNQAQSPSGRTARTFLTTIGWT
jgi:hypothetical protein